MDIKKIKVDTSRFDRDSIVSIRRVSLVPAGCALDLGDGSERGEYVNQDYVLNKLGRPHRNVGLMYTYYPKDKEWPMRSSEACPDLEVHGQWEYPYDDYFVYGGGLGGDRNAEVFRQMRDIRRHGQDVTLTLTVDCSLGDEHLIAIAKDLVTFGRMRIRINHECAGRWFTHNKRFSYKEIGDFFVRFHKIIKEYAPNVSTIFCSGFVGEDGKMEQEDAFLEAFRTADIWSGDRYLSLHFGWPFDICEQGDYHSYAVNKGYAEVIRATTERLKGINGNVRKPFSASEFNTDGDVTGPELQGKGILEFADFLNKERPEWYNSMSMYMFRDRGRLGLEMEDPNNPEVGIEMPLMRDYKKIMAMPYFQPGIKMIEELYSDSEMSEKKPDDIIDIPMRWGSAEDSDGLEIKLKVDKKPVFFDIELPEDQNLMISVNGRWFYKSKGIRIVDAMPAFFDTFSYPDISEEEWSDNEPKELSVLIFAPPADGENPDTGEADWKENYRSRLSTLPRFRIRYESLT